MLGVLAFVGLVPLASFAFELIRTSQRALKTSQQEIELQLASSIAGQIDSYMDGATRQLSAIADSLGATIGQQGARVIERAISAENKERLRRETETAWDLGIFGAPTCVVGGELFWGNDRMDDGLDWYTVKGGGGACPNT